MQKCCVSVPDSEVAPQELVTVLGDVFIDCNKMDDEKDGEAIVVATAQGTSTKSHTRKPIRKDPEIEPHGESYGESHWKCTRTGKAKSDVSTPQKTKKASIKKQDTHESCQC